MRIGSMRTKVASLVSTVTLIYIFLKTLFLRWYFSHVPQLSTAVLITPQVLKLEYMFLNNPYVLFVPFNGRKILSMSNSTVYLKNGDDSLEKVNLQPGVPFFVSANMLQKKEIIVDDYEENVKKAFSNDELVE